MCESYEPRQLGTSTTSPTCTCKQIETICSGSPAMFDTNSGQHQRASDGTGHLSTPAMVDSDCGKALGWSTLSRVARADAGLGDGRIEKSGSAITDDPSSGSEGMSSLSTSLKTLPQGASTCKYLSMNTMMTMGTSRRPLMANSTRTIYTTRRIINSTRTIYTKRRTQLTETQSRPRLTMHLKLHSCLPGLGLRRMRVGF